MYNSENRQIIHLVREICQENNITLNEFSDSWILKLSKNNKFTHIYGYRFESNSATTMLICNDKTATHMLLKNNDIESCEHYFFMKYRKYNVKEISNDILPYINKYKTIVLKNNNGTGGRLIYKVTDKKTLNYALKHIFSYSKFVSVSPYYDIKKEYRVIVCNGNVELIYEKVRPQVVGDGISTIKSLIQQLSYKPKLDRAVSIRAIPKQNEIITLNWKHNLYYGADAQMVLSKDIKNTLKDIALKTTKALKANFVSVDIVLIDGNYKVLEVNSGIMMEKFSTFSPENYQMAKNIYTKAILSCLE